MGLLKKFLGISVIFTICVATTASTEGLKYLQEYFVYPDDENDQVKIHWIPTTESNVQTYILEKSYDNKHFEEWKSMDAPEYSYEMLEVDFDPYEGWSYYRMTQILNSKDTLRTPTIPVFVGLEHLEKGELMVPEHALSEKTISVNLNSFNGQRLILVLRDQNNVEYLYDQEIYVDETGLFIKENSSVPSGKYTITASSQDYLLGLMIYVR